MAGPPPGGMLPGGPPVSSGATGVFPAGYVVPPNQAPAPGGYSPQPGQGRGRPPVKPVKPRRFIDYPRWGRQGWTRWLPSWKLIFAFIGIGILVMMAGIFAAYSATTLPPVADLAKAQTTVIYFKDGKSPIGELASQDRQSVPLKDVPKHVQDAVLAAEDHTFRTNSGVDPTSIARAVWSNLRGNSLQGGSTISQQYVKNVYDQRDRSYKRKIKEVFLAVKINRQLDKDKILEDYLNTIYLGRGAYGFQAAAHAYFGPKVDVTKLSVSQGAFLAGIINAPSAADPDVKDERDRAVRRWNVVVDAMVKEKWLDPADRANLKFPTTVPRSDQITLKGQNGFLKDMVVKEAAAKGFTEQELLTGGYKITTTFDRRMMNAGVKAVRSQLLAAKDRPKGINIGMTSIDPTTGAVRAIYGGPKYKGKENNNATISIAQAGSTFKTFGLAAALQAGYSLKTEYPSESPVHIGNDTFNNTEEHESSGYQDLVVATKLSLNTVFAQLNNDVGAAKTRDAAYAAGIPKDVEIRNLLSNVLGPASPHAIDMASAYGTFAAGGVQRTPYVIQNISLLGSKDVQYDKAKQGTKGKKAFDPGVAADVTYALQQVVKGGTASAASSMPFPVAGKTGTSTGPRSVWFVGYTPQLSTSVVMYQLGKVKVKRKTVTANVVMKGFGDYPNGIFGGGYPLHIWMAYMEAAMKGKKLVDFPDRADVGVIKNRAPVIVPTTPPATQTQDPNPQQTTTPPTTQPTTPAETQDPTVEPTRPTSTRTTLPTTNPTDPGGGGDGAGDQ